MPSPAHPPSLSLAISLPFQTRLPLLIYLSLFKDGQSVTEEKEGSEEEEKEGKGREEGGMHYAKQGLSSQSRQAEMRCQHCTGALMYECGEIKRVTQQTGGGWKGETACRERAAVHRRQGATIPPSLSSAITLLFSSLVFFFLLLYSTYLFICLLFFISNSVPLKRPQP